ncbi:hypothetical protein SAMN05421804_101269 [Proteiniclasticum ruminis]|uniref:Uncharacterized protein n=2 Tax=Proteiniclasticum ruminis TaxID=398199 RepID=A0A1G8GHV1_9CLOT|nr:hypothetical protein SAMN05421804_101269 [Proteiniclasticum ruminis]
MLSYCEDLKLKNGSLTEYDKKKISDIKDAIMKSDSDNQYNLSKDIDELIQTISTRGARFVEMPLDEKLKEIANLIENLLNKNGRYIDIDYHYFGLEFITKDSVKTLRKRLQCFRHSSKDALIERKTYSQHQKIVMVDYGVLICEAIYTHVKENE